MAAVLPNVLRPSQTVPKCSTTAGSVAAPTTALTMTTKNCTYLFSPSFLSNTSVDQNSPSDGKAKLVVHSETHKQNSIDRIKDVEEKNQVLRPKRVIYKKSFADELDDVKKNEKKKKVPSYTIALTKEEIKNDILAITGGIKLPRKSKGIPMNVKKNLNKVFPGLRLSSITVDSYKVQKRKGGH